jgi:RNA polymerase sigma-70 factor (ECF subfamily)
VAEARDAALPAARPSALGAVSAPSPAPSASERALVHAAQDGSAGAMEELFRRHWPRAHRAAWLVVHDAAAAEDVAQEAFLAAVRSIDRFDRRRPFGPWLHRIVVNRAIDYARAREGRREVPADAVAEAASSRDASRAPSDDVVAALAALAPEQRAVIVLRHLLGFTPGEIARVLGLPRGTVNSRLRRGLDALAGPLGAPDVPASAAPDADGSRGQAPA